MQNFLVLFSLGEGESGSLKRMPKMIENGQWLTKYSKLVKIFYLSLFLERLAEHPDLFSFSSSYLQKFFLVFKVHIYILITEYHIPMYYITISQAK